MKNKAKKPEYMNKRAKRALDTLGLNAGDEVVFYDEERRRVYFYRCEAAGKYRLKQVRGVRRAPVTVRSSDILVKLTYDGNVVTGRENIPQFIPQ